MQLKAILCRTSTKNSYAMHAIKITPNLLFEYQCTSGKFIRLPNRIEKIDSVVRIESNWHFFCPNWNALPLTFWSDSWISCPQHHSVVYAPNSIGCKSKEVKRGVHTVVWGGTSSTWYFLNFSTEFSQSIWESSDLQPSIHHNPSQ